MFELDFGERLIRNLPVLERVLLRRLVHPMNSTSRASDFADGYLGSASLMGCRQQNTRQCFEISVTSGESRRCSTLPTTDFRFALSDLKGYIKSNPKDFNPSTT